jgi:diphosphomevalonate decarboxylase
MKKLDVVQHILAGKTKTSAGRIAKAFAPTNIALCKYWGKRDAELNLPVTSSLSISLGDKGATTQLTEFSAAEDQITLNQQMIHLDTSFGRRLTKFLDLFRPTPDVRYQIDTAMNIPVAAGLASSACGFAAVILALNELYAWNIDLQTLSILARLGSGSATRSLWHGFVKWQAGSAADGMDSYGSLLPLQWPELRIGLHLLSTQQKPLSSTEAMQRTVKTSKLYSSWPQQVKEDMQTIQQALEQQNFEQLGQVAEANALAMHATMMSAWPPVIYSLPDTIIAMHKVWELRAQGIIVYFTQDAGPNLKLLFLESSTDKVRGAFPQLEICAPFNSRDH